MRKEVVWPIFLSLILISVFYSQHQLKKMAEDPAQENSLPFGESVGHEQEANVTSKVPKAKNAESPQTIDPKLLPSLPEAIKAALAEAQLSFQKKAELAALNSEELHHTPELMTQAADHLGQLIELNAQNPNLLPYFQAFYLQCTRDENAITVIRAQCLEQYMHQAQIAEGDVASFLSKFPDSVVVLYKAL